MLGCCIFWLPGLNKKGHRAKKNISIEHIDSLIESPRHPRSIDKDFFDGVRKRHFCEAP